MLIRTVKSNPQGWIVVGVCFLALSVISATRASLGLIMTELETDLGWSRGFVSSIAAGALIVMALTSPFIGNLLDRHGPRMIITLGLVITGVGLVLTSMVTAKWHYLLSYALLAGIGFAVVGKSIVSATIAIYFTRNRGLAVGIGSSGSTAGHLALLPALAAVLELLGWRYGYIFLGIASFALVPVAWILLRGSKIDNVKTVDAEPALTLSAKLRYLFRDRTYLALLGSYTICGFTTAGVVETHLLPYAEFCGIPRPTGALAFGVLAVFNMVGMATAGYLADRMNRPVLLASIYILRGFSFFILMLIPAYDVSLLFIFAVVFGLFDYSTIPVTTSLVASHLGLKVIGLAIGILGMFHAFGGAAGAFMGGYVYDLFNNYDWTWIAAIALAMVAGIMALTIRERRDDAELGEPLPAAG
ncbi:MAG: MFS transporter [Alphaproteobacteria bacterium]